MRRILLREESLVVAVPIDHPIIQRRQSTITIADLANENLLLYPKSPRPSFIDFVLGLFEERNIEPSSFSEVSELHVALGLVAAGEGITIVPQALKNLRGTEIGYIPLEDGLLTSPVIMNVRHFDKSDLLKTLLDVTYKLYDEEEFVYRREEI